MAWDPKTYLNFGAARTRPAAELLARVPIEAPARVADLGCGPGNSTALLAARWPTRTDRGARQFARDAGRRRANPASTPHWIRADVASWTPDAPCDVVFSNATLQWIADHRALLPRLMGSVAPGGALAVQVPRNFAEPCHTLIREVARGKAWAPKFEGVRDWWNMCRLRKSISTCWSRMRPPSTSGRRPIARCWRAKMPCSTG